MIQWCPDRRRQPLRTASLATGSEAPRRDQPLGGSGAHIRTRLGYPRRAQFLLWARSFLSAQP